MGPAWYDEGLPARPVGQAGRLQLGNTNATLPKMMPQAVLSLEAWCRRLSEEQYGSR